MSRGRRSPARRPATDGCDGRGFAPSFIDGCGAVPLAPRSVVDAGALASQRRQLLGQVEGPPGRGPGRLLVLGRGGEVEEQGPAQLVVKVLVGLDDVAV